MGYNPSYKDLDEFWSRTGLCAMACALRGEKRGMRTALTQVMVDRHPWIRNSHAYGEPGGALGLLGLNLAAPQDYRRVIAEYAWWFALAWEPGYGLRFTQPHMGAPYMGQDDLINAAYALVLAAPRRTLHLTGGTDRDWLDTSLLPAPLSEVRAKRNREGLVWLESLVGINLPPMKIECKVKRKYKYKSPAHLSLAMSPCLCLLHLRRACYHLQI